MKSHVFKKQQKQLYIHVSMFDKPFNSTYP